MESPPCLASSQGEPKHYAAAVTSTSRRIFLYWLLLLVPTVVVGVGAVSLLKREQERIAQQSAATWEARRAAAEARARLIVENVELLVGDVQEGLLDALAERTQDGVVELLREWEASNPLVRGGFVAREEGELLWPELRSVDESARGFLRRLAATFRENPPWRADAAAPSAARSGAVEAEATKARGAVTSNVLQVQSARRDVQQLVKAPSAAATDVAALEGQRLAAASAMERQRAEASARRQRELSARASRAAAPREEAERRASLLRGWKAVTIDGRTHAIGWVQAPAGGEVRGVELNLTGLVSRLGQALPAEVSGEDGYVLRDAEKRVVHQAGVVARAGEASVVVPIASALLPGWDVAAFVPGGAEASGSGAAFFWVGLLLVGIFLAAIVAGGSLLLWQARRSEEEAAQKTTFVANVSHEFKTPLTTIRLYAELLEQGRVRNPEQGGEYLRTIGRETQRLARLVNNALDFSRLEQGRKTFRCEEVDLKTELTRVLDTQTPRLEEAGIRLVRELPDGAVPVKTDRDAVEQIVLNLIENACKYAGESGEVTVRLKAREEGGAAVTAADRGPGVPAAHREKIFEKFHRVDDSLTAEKAGAGLGLSIARQLARGLGGELRYADRAGGGAEFILELP